MGWNDDTLVSTPGAGGAASPTPAATPTAKTGASSGGWSSDALVSDTGGPTAAASAAIPTMTVKPTPTVPPAPGFDASGQPLPAGWNKAPTPAASPPLQGGDVPSQQPQAGGDFYSTARPPPPDKAPIVQAAAAKYGVPLEIAHWVGTHESNWDTSAIGPQTSSGKAGGAWQIMGGTAKELGLADPHDFATSTDAAMRYLRQLYDRNGGDWTKAVASYGTFSTGLGARRDAMAREGFSRYLAGGGKLTQQAGDRGVGGNTAGGVDLDDDEQIPDLNADPTFDQRTVLGSAPSGTVGRAMAGSTSTDGQAQPQMMTAAERFGTGLKDPFVGGMQLGAHLLPGDYGQRADAYVREREADIQRTTPNPDRVETQLDQQGRASHVNMGKAPGPDPVRMMGQALSPPDSLPAMVGGPVVGGLISGAVTGGLTPVESNRYWTKKGEQVAIGAAAGAATGAAGRIFGGAIAPEFRPAAQRLIDAGVDLTPGQMAGGVLRRGEEAAKSIPLTGQAIAGAEMRTIDSFDRASVNQALAPIGVQVNPNLHGHELIDAGQRALSDAYDALVPQIHFQSDATHIREMRNLHGLVQEMPPDHAAQFNAYLQNRVMQRLQPNDYMDGATFKQVESELGTIARNYARSSDASDRQLGDAIRELQAQLRRTLERQNPAQADRLRDINEAYAMFVRVEGAASRRATSMGRFTPGDLLQTVKSTDNSVRKRTFARGDALLQDWAEAGHDVISNTLPNSGTADRMLWDAGILGGGYVANPWAPVGMAVGAAPYSRAGTWAANRWAQANPPWRQALGPRARSAGDFAGRAAAPLTAEELERRLGMRPRDSGSEALSRDQ